MTSVERFAARYAMLHDVAPDAKSEFVEVARRFTGCDECLQDMPKATQRAVATFWNSRAVVHGMSSNFNQRRGDGSSSQYLFRYQDVASMRKVARAACLHEIRRHRVRRRTGLAMARVASLLAGGARPHLHAEWAAHLSGDTEAGVELNSAQRRRMAAGFILAALRMRLSDLVRPLCRPVDWLLATADRTNGCITVAVGGLAVYVTADEGLAAAMEPCSIAAVGLYASARWVRRKRGIELVSRDSE